MGTFRMSLDNGRGPHSSSKDELGSCKWCRNKEQACRILACIFGVEVGAVKKEADREQLMKVARWYE